MNYKDAISYCLSLPGTTKQWQAADRHRIVLSVNGRCYGQFETGAPVQWQFTLRTPPEQAERLLNPPRVRRADWEEAGCWITIERLENFDGNQLKLLIDWSYRQAAGG